MPPTLHSLPFRQVHLDFHTSPQIPGIGKAFDKTEWQETLRAAAVNSITLFAKCHHGWSYHPTGVGAIHPHLGFDLLRAQYDATREAGIHAPIYLSAGLDNRAAHEHPEWREIDKDGTYVGWARRSLQPGFHTMDFHSPYLDYLCDQIREVVRLFPDCDGIFLDIIKQSESCGRWSLEFMKAHGLDPLKEEDRVESSRLAVEKYYQRTTAAARELRSDMPIFHNAGHIPRGRHDIFPYYSHLELESLPTGGWGYDHFPMSAKYACHLPFDFLGMTGKFHTMWGEFGGYKHPNALRYECAAMLAFGARCSVGDQLHPAGRLDGSTYRIIGEAYREVAAREPWCLGSRQVFDIGILSSEAESGAFRRAPSDEGACRMFLESHFLFGLIDRTMDFDRFRALVLPDDVRIDAALKAKLDAYLLQGGRLILSGASGLWSDRDEFAFDLGADHHGLSGFHPPEGELSRGHDYLLPIPELRPSFVDEPQIMYERSRRIRATGGASLGQVFDPYFNRTWEHFCSHRHTPAREHPSGFDCGVRQGAILYFAHPVFRNYRAFGAVASREFVVRAVRSFLGDAVTLSTNLPSTARLSLTVQPSENRHVLHLLYGPTIRRGGSFQLPGSKAATGVDIEVIEDLPALHDVEVTLRTDATTARLVPQEREIPLTRRDGIATLRLDRFSCHQMIELR
ncbi:MAG TPA: alpha-amylase family protein [Chthoniobacteraceae bacterium]|nr:alpha-amylase family protein [Chthoniobacteraceae bacterium]